MKEPSQHENKTRSVVRFLNVSLNKDVFKDHVKFYYPELQVNYW